MPAPATATAATLTIPWGDGPPLPLDLPASWPEPDVSWPDLDGTLPDYPEALAKALDAPAGGRPILEGLGPGKSVAIVVDDPSRWTPVRDALPILLARLGAAGVRDEDITLSVGVGRHHAVDDASMRKRVGDAIVDRFRCFSPPVDDLSQYVDLGTTADGVPVRVFRPVADANARFLLGSVLPHLQAGFGGGYKLIFPGTSHRSTLGALHRLGLGGDAGRLLGGTASANPMRQAIRAAAALLPGSCTSISHLMGEPGQVLRVIAGHPDAVQDDLAAEARRRFLAPAGVPADVVVAGNDPWPGDPLQSFKILLQHRAAGRPGGVLVGFFRTDPGEIDRSFPLPMMRAVAATGPLGGWVARNGLVVAHRFLAAIRSPNAFLLRWGRELIVDRTVLVYAPPLHERFGPRLGPFRIFDDRAKLWDAVAEALPKGVVPRVRVFPRGGLTYCPEAD